MNHKELDVWKISMHFVSEIYTLTKEFPKEEIFGLSNQMRRSAISIPSNIAEGAGRNHEKENKQFLGIARGSANELETQILVAQSLKYIDNEVSLRCIDTITRIIKMLNVMIKRI